MASSSQQLPSSPSRRPSRSRTWREILAERQPVEYTPANSIYEQDISRIRRPGFNKLTLQRIANGILHLVVTGMLLAIMACYLLDSEPSPTLEGSTKRIAIVLDLDSDKKYYEPISYYDDQCRTIALVVVAFTTIDLAIDLIHTFLLSLSWSAVALLPRLLLGMGYLAVFMAHVGLQKVFPPGYTYWGLRAEYAGPIVYLFLWALGVWDMLHVCVNRHQVGLDTRKWRDKITQRQVTSSMRRTQQQQGDFTHFRTSFGVENLTLPQMMSTTASVEANQGDLGTSRRATGSGAPMAIPSSSNFGERDKTSNRNITTGITPPAESGDSRLREGVGGINAPYS